MAATSPVAPQGGYTKLGIAGTFRKAIAIVRNPMEYLRQNNYAIPMRPLVVNYIAVLAIIPFVGTLIGDLWYYTHNGQYALAIPLAIISYIFEIIAVIVLGAVIWKLGPSFGTRTDQAKATTLAAYIYTPVFLASILYAIPIISIIIFLALLYGLYIFYRGAPIFLGTPQDKVLVYVIVVLIVSFVISLILSGIVGIATAALLR